MAFVTRALDPGTGDLALRDGKSYLITGEPAIAQSARTRCKMFLGEWYLNIAEGVPYFRDIFVKAPSSPAVTSIFRRVLLSSPCIVSVLKLDVTVNPRTRRATVTGAGKIDTGATFNLEPFVIA